MKSHFHLKGLLILYVFLFITTPIVAKPVIWEGTRVNPDEELLSGLLTINIEKGVAKGEIGGLSATGDIDIHKQFTLFFTPKGTTGLNANAGTFEGYITKTNELRGHWIRYGMKIRAWTPYATPVHFSQKGQGKGTSKRYEGTIAPLKDELSIFFVGEPTSDDSYAFEVFIPQTNYGRFYRHSELRFSKDKVAWVVTMDDGTSREIDGGKYDASSGVFHMQLPHWGNGVQFKEVKDVRGLVPAKRHKAYTVPEQKKDGWPVGNADQLGLDSKVLERFGDMLSSEPPNTPREAQTEAFLVARNGVLVFERYFRGYDAEEPHDLRSASKSLTGILPGLIEQAGLLSNGKRQNVLDTPLYQTLGIETDDARKQAITLEHILSMSTGLDCDDNQRDSPGGEDRMQSQQEQLDWFRFILDLDAVYTPGNHLAYCSGGINLTGAVLTAKTQQWMPTLIEELFAQPLGIKRYHINLLPDGQQAYSGGGLQLTARDFLKMGQLMLNKGRWGDQQLLSPDYVESVLTPRGIMFDKGYGLGWWISTYEVDGRSYRVFAAGGNGGQQIFAIPELDMVAVSLGSAYGTRGSFKMRDDWFPNIVLKHAIKQSKE